MATTGNSRNFRGCATLILNFALLSLCHRIKQKDLGVFEGVDSFMTLFWGLHVRISAKQISVNFFSVKHAEIMYVLGPHMNTNQQKNTLLEWIFL